MSTDDHASWDEGGEMPLREFKSLVREIKRINRRKMRVSGRSVFELQRLRARPLKPRRRDTRRGPRP